jgi:hypothetical protein
MRKNKQVRFINKKSTCTIYRSPHLVFIFFSSFTPPCSRQHPIPIPIPIRINIVIIMSASNTSDSNSYPNKRQKNYLTSNLNGTCVALFILYNRIIVCNLLCNCRTLRSKDAVSLSSFHSSSHDNLVVHF